MERTMETPRGTFVGVPVPEVWDNIETLEKQIADGKVYAEMNNGRFWQVRRNGATKRWKREPDRFRIPIKVGLRGYAAIENDNVKHFYIALDV